MPDLVTIAGGPSETASTPGSSTVTTITANASANTKASSWTELIASTAYDTSWVSIKLSPLAVGWYLVDIGIGASTSEIVIIPDLTCGTTVAAANAISSYYLFPLRIPRGSRISARCQSSVGSNTVKVQPHLYSAPIDAPPSPSRIESAGIVSASSRGTNIDAGGTANTDVKAELSASLGHNWNWMNVALDGPSMTLSGTFEWLVDILKGPNGSEVIVIPDLHAYASSGIDRPDCPVFTMPTAIAAGERLAAQARCSQTTATDRIITVAAWGCG